MRFDLRAGSDPLAVRLALAASASPLRVVRRAGAVSVTVSAADAAGARLRWLRVGLVPAPAEPWPQVVGVEGGVLRAGASRWCVGRASLDALAPAGELVLRLVPVPREDALRAIAAALRGRIRFPFRRVIPALARDAAAIAANRDGVVAARAYMLAGAALAAEAERSFAHASRGLRPRPSRLRASALAAWRDIEEPAGGVWRVLSALEGWWS